MKKGEIAIGNRKELRSCYISASANLNIRPLMDLLRNKGIDSFDAFSAPHMDRVLPSVEKEIRNSDFLIAVVNLGAPKPNVFYEIGFARAVKKPIFLIVEGVSMIPTLFKDLVYVKAKVDDVSAINYVLSQFLAQQKYSVRRGLKTIEPPKAKPDIKFERRDLEGIVKQGREVDLANFVAKLLKSKGVILDRSFGVREEGSDMSLWIDSLEYSIGNPILVEIKIGNLSNTSLAKTEEQLRKYIKTSNASAGLIIYADRRGKLFRPSRFKLPLVIRLSFEELIDRLAKQPIDRIILSERNRIAHLESRR